MARIKLILSVIIAFILLSCTSKEEKILKLADSVMESRPDSAMTILKTINRRNLSKAELPYYALLYTQAQVKIDVTPDSDSLVSIAHAKYGNLTRGNRGLRSNFYMGEIFFNQKDYRHAMRYYISVYEVSKQHKDDYWHAKAAERISDLFFYSYNYDEAEKYALEAAELFKKIGRQTFHRYTLGKLGNILSNNDKNERAFTLLDSLKNISIKETPIDSAFLEYIYLPLLGAMESTGKILEYDKDSLIFSHEDMTREEICEASIIKSYIYNELGIASQATTDLLEAEELASSSETRAHILYAIYENAKNAGNLPLAISVVDTMLMLDNELTREILRESVVSMQRDYYTEMAVIEKNKSDMNRKLLFLSIGVFILIGGFAVVLLYLRNRIQKTKLESSIQEILTLKEYVDHINRQKEEKETERENLLLMLNTKNQEKEENQVIIEQLFKQKWHTLDMLCTQYFSLYNSELTEKGILANIEKEVKRIVSKNGLSEIVDAVDKYMDDIMSRLRQQCKFLKEEDLNFLALLYAGFSVRTVCLFTGISYRNYYVKKSRLGKRIQDSDAQDKELFISKLK